ncbi:MAG: thymidine phosphorylase [Anaerolineaceae bacterium]|nr:MAG: thymidine phosphorylase [Anaerolineaceae bacterium]
MHAVDIIEKKRDGEALSPEEIKWFIQAYTADDIPDYQAAAFCMAVLLRGMDTAEVTALTLAMVASGDTLDLSAVGDYVVDKHSSGGVGDKTSLVVLPLVAALGVPVAKMSGRGLGLSGGTLDKLEAIAGFNVNLAEDVLIAQAQRIGLALGGQTRQLAPADGKLYALRDVTGTVPSIPLIASSIMSKKIAAGAQGIVLDVKVGEGAFMESIDAARELAAMMVGIGRNVGRDMVALLSSMDQPLGLAVGNALEVAEAIHTLRGDGPADFVAHSLEVAAHMLYLAEAGAGRPADIDAARGALSAALDDGRGLDKFRQMVSAQGGDPRMVDEPSLLPQAAQTITVTAPTGGYVARVAARPIARAAFLLGAGRERKDDKIDPAVGVRVAVKVGDAVSAGDVLATLHVNDSAALDQARQLVEAAYHISAEPVARPPLFHGVMR